MFDFFFRFCFLIFFYLTHVVAFSFLTNNDRTIFLLPISSKNVKNAKITNAKPAQSGPTAQDLKESTAVWMCLKCAIQCCSTPSESIKEKHQIGIKYALKEYD